MPAGMGSVVTDPTVDGGAGGGTGDDCGNPTTRPGYLSNRDARRYQHSARQHNWDSRVQPPRALLMRCFTWGVPTNVLEFPTTKKTEWSCHVRLCHWPTLSKDIAVVAKGRNFVLVNPLPRSTLIFVVAVAQSTARGLAADVNLSCNNAACVNRHTRKDLLRCRTCGVNRCSCRQLKERVKVRSVSFVCPCWLHVAVAFVLL